MYSISEINISHIVDVESAMDLGRYKSYSLAVKMAKWVKELTTKPYN